ncbi:ATP-grasp domain-containing protein [Bacillus glycinifermentans]|uniref:ATP-grasp domain-containing protein n=1 Tax=Bacillus glycinifermentans TaxID=1664069 RepID=UPI0022E5DB71|nr:ATP-grasp domain-containing protein [Bacillus glycinifermentans]MEC0493235.1 ATP-grasp domain-containing protein [Bacillus glycinifermentans]MEC0542533.1 ATP-grasp domain-containing protein [Bacillus glycinifermentans]
MNNKNKTILYINLRSHPVERVEPLKQARKMGLRVALLTDKKPDIDLSLVDDILMSNTYCKETALKDVLKYQEKHPISGVLTWSDKDVELVSYIANKLGLPGPSAAAAKNARSKYLMRKSWESVPGLSPKFNRVTSLEDLKSAAEKLTFPLIFKPVGASGSKSILLIESEDDLEDAYQRMTDYTSPDKDKIYSYFPNEYIAEEYLDGPEVTVDGLVQDGKVYIAGVIDKHITPQYSMEYFAEFPSSKSEETIKEIEEKAEQAVKALGLNNSAFHLECRVTSYGVRMIECAARPGGGFIASHLIKMATDHAFMEEVIKMAIGEQVNFEKLRDYKRYAGMIILLPEEKGYIKRIEGVVQALEIDCIKKFIPAKQVGDKVNIPPEDFSAYYGVFIGQSDNYKELEDALFKAKDTIRFTVKEG